MRLWIGIGPAVAVSAALLAGCAKKHQPTAPTPGSPMPQTQLTGVFVGGSENGLLDVTIDLGSLAMPGDTVVSALGVMSKDGGGVVNLTGTYDTATDSLRLSGQGFELAGLYLEGGAPIRIEGRFVGPADSGSGLFTALPGRRPSAVHAFCATYENSAATMWGTLNFAVAGNGVAGFEVVDGETAVVAVQGTAAGTTGTTRSLAFAGSDFIGNGSWNMSTGHVAGVWASPRGSGVWSGDLCIAGTTGSE
ncbi:MAG TPA: hypothetical protein VFM00_06850 [Candidatus Eisenbacteria bacterium]|nr:hypothetical protein [Candidatus Eisenbacteria bacterium]